MTERIHHIDGLRALAILMVVLYHAWVHVRFGPNVYLENRRAAAGIGFIAQRGYLGVSLFFVISGFSLAYSSLRRRQHGVMAWFTPSDFFARRCLRILPPYGVALILALSIDAVAVHSGHAFADQQQTPGAGDVLSHLLLLHNLTRFNFSINGSFWSLGLEWQWYFLFPLALALCILYPRLTLAVTLLISLGWDHALPGSRLQFSPFQRLFEFCCGILAARLTVEERTLAPRLLVVGLIVPMTVAELAYAPWFPHRFGLGTEMGLGQSLYGISFACLALLGFRVGWLTRLLSWPFLVAIGTASYSIYLVHEPVVEIVDLALARDQLLAIPLAILLGVAAGWMFYVAVEHPLTRKGVTARAIPRVQRLFLWSDRLWRPSR